MRQKSYIHSNTSFFKDKNTQPCLFFKVVSQGFGRHVQSSNSLLSIKNYFFFKHLRTSNVVYFRKLQPQRRKLNMTKLKFSKISQCKLERFFFKKRKALELTASKVNH